MTRCRRESNWRLQLPSAFVPKPEEKADMSFLSTAAERVLSARFALPLGNIGMTVLIAHPEPVVRDTLSVALGMCAPRTGRVLEAGSLSETLAQLRTHAVD